MTHENVGRFEICKLSSDRSELPSSKLVALYAILKLREEHSYSLSASTVVEPTQDQSKIEPAFAPNESAKARQARAAQYQSGDSGYRAACEDDVYGNFIEQSGATKRVTDRNWQNANAKVIAVASPRRHTKSKVSKQSAGKYPQPKEPRSGTADRTPRAVF